MTNFPKRTLFDEYIAPNIFLYAGKFQDYNSAELFKKELEKVFKNTLIVRKKFPYKKEKKQSKKLIITLFKREINNLKTRL